MLPFPEPQLLSPGPIAVKSNEGEIQEDKEGGRETAVYRRRRLITGSPRKTRDLPDLQECQSCGFRIDICDGKSQLKPLYSEWRLLLLCNKCFSLVESSLICPYCFKDTLEIDCFVCCQCGRSVHTSCFYRFKNVPPWCYSCSGVDKFTVCVDCWLPKPILSRRKALKVAHKKKTKFLDSRSPRDLNVEKGVDVEKVLAVEDKETGPRNGENDYSDAGSAVDDTELAFQLHRAINSSPRFSKRTTVPEDVNLNGDVVKRRLLLDAAGGHRNSQASTSTPSVEIQTLNSEPFVDAECSKPTLKVYTRKRLKDPKRMHVCESSSDNADSRLKEGGGSVPMKVYVRRRLGCNKNKVSPDDAFEKNGVVRENGSGNACDTNSACTSFSNHDGVTDLKDARSEKPDRYHFKYSRIIKSKLSSEQRDKNLYEGFLNIVQTSISGLALDCGSTKLRNSIYDNITTDFASRSFCNQNNITEVKNERSIELPDRYLMKYQRKLKSVANQESRGSYLYQGFLNHVRSSTSGLHLDSSKESVASSSM